MTLIDADVFLAYLIFSKHIDSLKCRDVKEAVEMSKVDVIDKIRAEIEAEIKGCETAIDMYKENPDIVLCYKTFIQSYTKTLQIIDKYREEQEDNGFFDDIMDDESDGEAYDKIKEIIDKVKEQEK